MMNIDDARVYLKTVMSDRFTDRTFERYIDETLAGDFAVEIANSGKGLEEEVMALTALCDGYRGERDRLMELSRHQSDHPQRCPITGRDFFMVMEHPERGEVATYGGPFDSYTIPERDEDNMLCCERFDHDEGYWVDGGEIIGLRVVDDSACVDEDELREEIVRLQSALTRARAEGMEEAMMLTREYADNSSPSDEARDALVLLAQELERRVNAAAKGGQ